MASSNSPCAACKFLRRKCTQECVFAPYFPPDQPQKFSNVHKVFGASNVAKLLNDLPSPQREDAVNSLAYEAEMRLRDPVYGCVGIISVLQHSLKQIQLELYNARKELATYIGPSAMHPLVLPTHNPQILHHHQNASSSMGGGGGPFGGMSQMGLGMPPPGPSSQSQILIREQQQQQQQMLEAQQIAAMAAREQQEQLLRSYEQQQQELVRYNSGGFDGNSGSSGGVFNHMSAGLSSNLALVPMDNSFQIQQQSQQQQELLHHQQTPQTNQNHQELQVPHQQQRAGSDEGNSGIVGPSS